MSNFPDDFHGTPTEYNEEWSKAALAALAIAKTFRKFKEDANWLTGGIAQHTSQGIANRWQWLERWTAEIRKHGEIFSESMIAKLETELKLDMDLLDEANMDFQGREDIDGLVQAVEQYAEDIIAALKMEMSCDKDGDDVEAEQFERERE